MHKRSKSPQKRRDGSAKRVQPRRNLWWLVAVAGIGLVITALYFRWSLSFSVPVSTTPAPQPTNEAAISDSERDQALRAEQLDAAQKLLAEFPNNDDAVYLAGLIHNDQGDTETAMKLWQRSLELDGTRADANESLGYALLLRDEYEEAEKYFRKALQIDPSLLSARFRLATALSQQGKMKEVITVLEEAKSLSPEAHRLMGEAHQQLKNYAEAKQSHETAIQLNPDFTEAHYGLSKVLTQLGDTEGAKDRLEKFSALKQQSEAEARRVRASFDSLAVTRKSVARMHTDVGRVYMTMGRHKEAEQLWHRAAALDAENALCRLQLAVLCQQTGRYREALEAYEQVARLDPTDGLAQLNMGRVCLKLNLPERAEQAFRNVIKVAPDRPDGHRALAQLYLEANRNLAEAVRLAETAVTLAPDAPGFALLSQAQAKNGDHAAALTTINKAIELQPGEPRYLRQRELLLGRNR